MDRIVRSIAVFVRTKVVPLLQETYTAFHQDNVMVLSAALAYFAIFSLFPLLLVILGLVGLFVGSEDSVVRQVLRVVAGDNAAIQNLPPIDLNQQIVAFARTSISPEVAMLIDETLRRLNEGGVAASLIGVIVLFWAASNVFGQIDWAFQVIWKVDQAQAEDTGILTAMRIFVKRRILAFGLVMVSALLLFISLLANVILAVIRSFVPNLLGDVAWGGVSFATAFVLLFVTLLLIFKYLPKTRVAWHDVWIGALLTAILITLLVNLGGALIGNRNFLAYGAVGSVMALLFWIFLSSAALYTGAEFTHVYARMYGSHRPPSGEPPQASEQPPPQEKR